MGLEASDQPTELSDRVLQQVGVGRVVDVGLHHGGVHPQLASPQQLAGGEFGHQGGVQLLDRLRAGSAHQLDQRGGMGHRPVQADPAAPPPADRVTDFLAQALIAELVAVLEVQQPQQGVDRDRWAAQPTVEQRPPRRDEALVVQEGVDLGELGGQALEFLGQQRLPQRGLRVALAQHR
jgi:hypothetical protein